MAPQVINWAIYNSLPPEEAKYQLAHVHDSKRKSMATAYVISYLISFSAVIMRFISRRIGRIPYQRDDWFIVVALILSVLTTIPSISGICDLCELTSLLTGCLIEESAAFIYGGAHHAILLNENDQARFAKSVFASELLYAPTIAVVKISTLLLYARIFPGRTFRFMLWAVGLFISAYSAIFVITTLLQCRPLSRVWDPTVKAECIELNKVWIVMGSLNVLTDVLLLCLPLPSLWRLQMRKRTKLQVAGIFSIGSCVTVISIYRIPQMHILSLYSYDPTWIDVEPDLWSVVEVSVAILGACAITYRPLIKWISRNWVPKIQPFLPRQKGEPSKRGYVWSINGNNKPRVKPNDRPVINMHSLSVSLPSVPASIYDPPRKEDAVCPIDESANL